MLSIPGAYAHWYNDPKFSPRPLELVSLKQAQELGISIHSSEESMRNFAASQNSSKKFTAFKMRKIRWLSRSSEENRSLQGHVSDNEMPQDNHAGMASIGFPVLRLNGMVENGVWCSGCRMNYGRYNILTVLDEKTKFLLSNADPLEGSMGIRHCLWWLEYRVRSNSAFIEHLNFCTAAQKLLESLENGLTKTPIDEFSDNVLP